ncbi:hypothetical protein [Bombiscardovia coagulans]|uniref:Uncharacterized protein n=1 Tax=Bombiscardovia coagulans TaxID=686666 RepID=A0A261ETV6_9BIFI|nr:hypothetical protein [Bombiscardovia coagulans]OZG50255.1 hypothetical protein BOCO_0772 [Bombiscardovia coagulans]
MSEQEEPTQLIGQGSTNKATDAQDLIAPETEEIQQSETAPHVSAEDTSTTQQLNSHDIPTSQNHAQLPLNDVASAAYADQVSSGNQVLAVPSLGPSPATIIWGITVAVVGLGCLLLGIGLPWIEHLGSAVNLGFLVALASGSIGVFLLLISLIWGLSNWLRSRRNRQ